MGSGNPVGIKPGMKFPAGWYKEKSGGYKKRGSRENRENDADQSQSEEYNAE